MTSNLPNIIQYFHDCYRSDNRELMIYDFLDRKVEEKIFIESKEELITNEHPIIPIDSVKAENILKKLEIYQREKELLYGAFFVCGQYIDFKGEQKRLCSPLFYYPATIEARDEFHYLSINPDERRINLPLINLLSTNNDSDILNDPILKQFPSDYIQFGDISKIVNLFKKYFPQVNFDNIYGFPEITPIKSVKNSILKLSKEDPTLMQLLPFSILGIVSKSTSTRGVLNELNELALQKNISTPLRYLFQKGATRFSLKTYRPGYIPMILSEAQKQILMSSSINPSTLIIGPPGTGKSYTICAIAIEHMSRGESVLIASRTNEAVDVLASKLSNILGTDKCFIRGGKKRIYKTPLNRFLKSLLTRVNTLSYLSKAFNVDSYTIKSRSSKIRRSISERIMLTEQFENSFKKEVKNELEWGLHLFKQPEGIWEKLKTRYLQLRNKFQTPIWEHSEILLKMDDEHIDEVEELIRLNYISQVIRELKNNWFTINKFHEAFKLSNDTEKIKRFNDINFKKVLKTFPIWLTNLSEVKDAIPFQTELYDVVIIDEATQCDIASCLPVLQRAKRCVFAGDPNQLRHVSFLSGGLQAIYKNKYDLNGIDNTMLDYRNNSILDLAKNALHSGNQVAMLDEHFRSLYPIISFSNKEFYGNDLRIMTVRPEEEEQALYFFQCEGKRSRNGSNQIEALNLFKDVRKIVDLEEMLSHDVSSSIGILSPFRGQVDLLSKKLLEDFTLTEINKHQMRVGTAYSFQGEERDYMYISFAVDKGTHHSAYFHINKEDVFNVSITRARTRQFVYLSVSYQDLPQNSILRNYITASHSYNSQKYSSVEYHDKFLNEVKEVLSEWEIEDMWINFHIAGMKVDILIKQNENFRGINLVGYPGEFSDTFGIDQYRILNRAGVRVFPLPYSDWYFDFEDTKMALKEFLFGQSLTQPSS